jgi:hypothetical protein
MQQIVDWLTKLGMSEYGEERTEIDVLPELTDQALRDLASRSVTAGGC